jgi:hypothetical protein
MANSVRVRRRSSLPGAGFDSSGNPTQTKEQVVGKVIVTNYEIGENLDAAKLGLTAIDTLHLQLDEGLQGATDVPRLAVYSASAGQFYVLEQLALAGEWTNVPATADPVLSFVAEGDATRRPELL